MADNSKKSAGIPDWQKAYSAASNRTMENGIASVSHPQDQSASQSTPTSSLSLVEQGKRFLLEDSTKDATPEQRISFLQSKGLSKTEIEEAEVLAQSVSSRSIQSQLELSAPASAVVTSASSNQQPTPPSPFSRSVTSRPLEQQSSPPQVSREVAPIITYPEFLLHAQRPPPIITGQRLINTAYVASAIGTAFYIASKYFITPMTETLTEARHDFASHTQSHLNELNLKLGKVVSADPKNMTPRIRIEDFDDVASVDSDPTELFHRDYGTQTPDSLTVEEKPYDSSSNVSDAGGAKNDTTTYQIDKLDEITTNCTAITNCDMIIESETKGVLDAIKSLREDLEKLAYPVYSSAGSYAGGSTTFGLNNDTKDDEVKKFRAEIRSVKGTLLSARNFPSTVRRAGMPS